MNFKNNQMYQNAYLLFGIKYLHLLAYSNKLLTNIIWWVNNNRSVWFLFNVLSFLITSPLIILNTKGFMGNKYIVTQLTIIDFLTLKIIILIYN
ncbi:MAG: hypothetical protein ACI9CD_000099 [Candidatus Deianiraeaceae bacterium]|jgi:hypothetical protein